MSWWRAPGVRSCPCVWADTVSTLLDLHVQPCFQHAQVLVLAESSHEWPDRAVGAVSQTSAPEAASTSPLDPGQWRRNARSITRAVLQSVEIQRRLSTSLYCGLEMTSWCLLSGLVLLCHPPAHCLHGLKSNVARNRGPCSILTCGRGTWDG